MTLILISLTRSGGSHKNTDGDFGMGFGRTPGPTSSGGRHYIETVRAAWSWLKQTT